MRLGKLRVALPAAQSLPRQFLQRNACLCGEFSWRWSSSTQRSPRVTAQCESMLRGALATHFDYALGQPQIHARPAAVAYSARRAGCTHFAQLSGHTLWAAVGPLFACGQLWPHVAGCSHTPGHPQSHNTSYSRAWLRLPAHGHTLCACILCLPPFLFFLPAACVPHVIDVSFVERLCET
jgi:hypothetical protein